MSTQRLSQSTLFQTDGPIRRTHSLPCAGEILVRVGQDVTAGQVIARAATPTGYTVVEAARELDIPARELPDLLLVKPGTAVQKGRPLVRKKTVLGVRTLTAPVSGLLQTIRHGRIILTHPATWTKLHARFTGTVKAAADQRHIELNTTGSLLQAMWGSGFAGHGPLILTTPTPTTVLEPHALEHLMPGDVVVAGIIDSIELLNQIRQIGVTAVIAGSTPSALCSWAQRQSLPLILTDGIGRQGMAPHFFAQFEQYAGKEASVNGNPISHARPEIIIPHPSEPTVEAYTQAAQWVRILQTPHHSTVGLLNHFYQSPQTNSIGLRVHGADISLAHGQHLFVPAANLDQLVQAPNIHGARGG